MPSHLGTAIYDLIERIPDVIERKPATTEPASDREKFSAAVDKIKCAAETRDTLRKALEVIDGGKSDK
jgi:hypothetical protein